MFTLAGVLYSPRGADSPLRVCLAGFSSDRMFGRGGPYLPAYFYLKCSSLLRCALCTCKSRIKDKLIIRDSLGLPFFVYMCGPLNPGSWACKARKTFTTEPHPQPYLLRFRIFACRISFSRSYKNISVSKEISGNSLEKVYKEGHPGFGMSKSYLVLQ